MQPREYFVVNVREILQRDSIFNKINSTLLSVRLGLRCFVILELAIDISHLQ